MQRFQFGGRRHAQAVQGLGHALFKNTFQLAPLACGALAQSVSSLRGFLCGLSQFFFGGGVHLALHGDAIAHQLFKRLGAVLLRLSKCAQACQPYLLCLLFHVVRHCCGIEWVFGRHVGTLSNKT